MCGAEVEVGRWLVGIVWLVEDGGGDWNEGGGGGAEIEEEVWEGDEGRHEDVVEWGEGGQEDGDHEDFAGELEDEEEDLLVVSYPLSSAVRGRAARTRTVGCFSYMK